MVRLSEDKGVGYYGGYIQFICLSSMLGYALEISNIPRGIGINSPFSKLITLVIENNMAR